MPPRRAWQTSAASLYVTWSELDGTNFELRFSRLNADGTAWEQVGGGPSPINQASNQDAFQSSLTAIGGVPHVAWSEWDGTNNEIRVSRPDAAGTAWEQVVGGASPINHANNRSASSPSLTAIGGAPYIAWREWDGTNDEMRVSRLDAAGSSWEQVVGGASPINHANNRSASSPRLTTVGGVPYVAWSEPDGPSGKIRVSRLEPDLRMATSTTDSSATLALRVHSHGSSFPVRFDYGDDFSGSTPTVNTSGGTETITQTIEGLTPSTAYVARPIALAGGPPVARGEEMLFVTAPRAFQGAAGPAGSTGAEGPAGPVGPQGVTGPEGPAGRDALVTCRFKRGERPKVKCTVAFPSAGARAVKLELFRKGTVYARGATRSGGSVSLATRRRLARGRYSLRITTVAEDGGQSLSASRIRFG